MRSESRDDRIVHEAIQKMNRGDHVGAAALFQRAGNQYRDFSEKKELWKAAERSRRIAASD